MLYFVRDRTHLEKAIASKNEILIEKAYLMMMADYGNFFCVSTGFTSFAIVAQILLYTTPAMGFYLNNTTDYVLTWIAFGMVVLGWTYFTNLILLKIIGYFMVDKELRNKSVLLG
jgi:hypothetical protein